MAIISLFSDPESEEPSAAKQTSKEQGPHGLGGILVIPLLAVVFSTLMQLRFLVSETAILIKAGNRWYRLSTRWLLYHSVHATLHLFFVLFLVTVFALFLRRDWRVPRLMVTLVAATFAIAMGEYVYILVREAHQIRPPVPPENRSGAVAALIGSFLSLVIWVPYFLVSKRVRNTFRKRSASPLVT